MKKCIICHTQAQYAIKDTTDYYCADCAIENFGGVDVLVSIEEQAQALKKAIDEKAQKLKDDEGKIKPILNDEDAVSFEVNSKD